MGIHHSFISVHFISFLDLDFSFCHFLFFFLLRSVCKFNGENCLNEAELSWFTLAVLQLKFRDLIERKSLSLSFFPLLFIFIYSIIPKLCVFCVLCVCSLLICVPSFKCIHVKFSLAKIISPKRRMKIQINDYHGYFSILLLLLHVCIMCIPVNNSSGAFLINAFGPTTV